MRLLLCSSFAVVIAAACKPPENVVPDSGMHVAEGCPISFSHRALSSASSVVVVGEWNQFDRLAQPLKDATQSGTWTGTFDVPPGRWAYVYLENGSEVVDPEATYVRYVDGRAWSGLRVADCAAGS